MADGEPVRRLELGDVDRVGDRDAEDPDVGLGDRADPDRAGRLDADRLHVVHPARLALDVGHGLPDALDRRVDDDHRLDRLGFLAGGLLGEDAIDGVGDAGAGEREPERAADHRITVLRIPTPAASHLGERPLAVARF